MYISEFSSLVFDQENYKYDQKAYDIEQLFGTNDKIRLGIYNIVSEITNDLCSNIKVEISKYNEISGSFDTLGDMFLDTDYPQSTENPRPLIKCVSNGSYWVVDLRDMILDLTSYETKEELYGHYRVRITDTENDPDHYVGAEFCIRSDYELENTFEIRYTNNRNIFDTVFKMKNLQTNRNEAIYYSFRFVGSILKRETKYGITAVVGSDQENYSTLLSGFKKDTYKLCMGDNFGVPNGWARLLRNALSCNETYLNGTKFSLSDEQDLERENIGDYYPFFRFSVTINMEYDVYEDNKVELLQVIGSNNRRIAFVTNDREFYIGYNKQQENEFIFD